MNRSNIAEYFPTFRKVPASMFASLRAILVFPIRRWKEITALLMILAVIHGISTVILGRQVERKIAVLRAKGEPISAVELAGSRIADDVNGAIIFESIFKQIPAGSHYPDNEYRTPFPRYSEILSPDKRKNNPEAWKQAKQAVARYGHIFPMIEQATSRPYCRFKTNWEDGAAVLFPYIAPLSELNRLLAARAILDARDGRIGEALHSVQTNFRLSDSLKDGPAVILQLNRIHIVHLAANSLRNVAAYGNISQNEAERLSDELARIDLIPGWVAAMQGERDLIGLWVFDQHGKYGTRVISRIINGPPLGGRSLLDWLPPSKIEGYIWRPIVYLDELTYLRLWNRQMGVARLPYREVVERGLDRALQKDLDHSPRYAVVSRGAIPVFAQASLRRDSGVAEISGSQIFLALHAYKDRFGMYPESLGELRSRLGWVIPADPFSGKDFIYRRQENGFLLYSIGEDLMDDGGQPWKSRSRGRVGDIIWRMDG